MWVHSTVCIQLYVELLCRYESVREWMQGNAKCAEVCPHTYTPTDSCVCVLLCICGILSSNCHQRDCLFSRAHIHIHTHTHTHTP